MRQNMGNQTGVYRILVGTDLSETGDHALRQAVGLAKELPQSELHVTYVISVGTGKLDAHRIEQVSRELPAKLEQLRTHVTSVCAPSGDEPSFKVETVFHVRVGDPARALHQVAVDVDADLIVVGTHARRGVEKWMLGSVAETLVRESRVGVLVAHPKEFTGLRRSDRVEPPRPGQEIHDTGLSNRLHLEFPPRTPHISGLV